jgi:hypothetical protein
MIQAKFQVLTNYKIKNYYDKYGKVVELNYNSLDVFYVHIWENIIYYLFNLVFVTFLTNNDQKKYHIFIHQYLCFNYFY